MLGRDDSKTRLFSDCEDVIKTGKAQNHQIQTYQNLRGETRWIQIDKLPYRDAHGDMTGIIVFAVDITEFRQVQTESQTVIERLQTVIKNMPLMFLAFDQENRLVEWNRNCEIVTGFSVDEMVGSAKTLEWLFPEAKERERMLNGWETLEEGQGGWESQITCRNNKTKMVAWSCVAKRYPIACWRTWYLGQDITLRKQSEQMFRQSQALLASVFESAKIGVCLTDDRGRFVQVNRAFAGFYGYRPDELLGQVFTHILPTPQHSDAVRDYYSLLMTQDAPTLLRRRSEQHRDGHLIEVLMFCSRVVLEDKRRLLMSVVSKANEVKKSD
jgi:PAS domain S-box-containing protein